MTTSTDKDDLARWKERQAKLAAQAKDPEIVTRIRDAVYSWHEELDPKHLTTAHDLLRGLVNRLNRGEAPPADLSRLVHAFEVVTGDLEIRAITAEQKRLARKQES
jgi:hypothetical protein